MGKFRHALPRQHLGQATPVVLMQQDRDEPGLRENDRAHDYDLP